MTDLTLRPRTVSEIVDGAFALYRANSAQYILVAALGNAPLLVLQLLVPDGTTFAPGSSVLTIFLMFLASIVTYSLMSATVIQLGSRYYLGEGTDLAQSVRAVLPKVPRLLLASIYKGFLFALGILVFFVGYLYVAARYFSVSTVIVLENRGAGEALGRSSALSKDRKKHILSTLALVGIIYLVLSLGVGLLAGLAGNRVVQLLFTTLFTIVAYPVIGLTEMLLYYDVRIRAEGFDLERMAASLDSAGAAPPSPTS